MLTKFDFKSRCPRLLNMHALYPSRCKQRGIAFKIKDNAMIENSY